MVCQSGHLVPKNRGLRPSYMGNIRLYMNSGEFRYGLCLDCSKTPNLERLRLRWHRKRHWQRHWTKSNHLQCLERCRAVADLWAKGSITFSLWSFMRRGVGRWWNTVTDWKRSDRPHCCPRAGTCQCCQQLSAGRLGMLGLGRDGYIFILLVIALSLNCDLPKAIQSPQLESWNLNLGALGT